MGGGGSLAGLRVMTGVNLKGRKSVPGLDRLLRRCSWRYQQPYSAKDNETIYIDSMLGSMLFPVGKRAAQDIIAVATSASALATAATLLASPSCSKCRALRASARALFSWAARSRAAASLATFRLAATSSCESVGLGETFSGIPVAWRGGKGTLWVAVAWS